MWDKYIFRNVNSITLGGQDNKTKLAKKKHTRFSTIL